MRRRAALLATFGVCLLLVSGCGGSDAATGRGTPAAQPPPSLPDESGELAGLRRAADAVCGERAATMERLTVELTDYLPDGTEQADLSEIIANPRARKDLRRSSRRSERAHARAVGRLQDIEAPAGIAPVVERWIEHYASTLIASTGNASADADNALVAQRASIHADIYATLLGIERCLMADRYRVSAAERVTYNQIGVPIGQRLAAPTTESGRVARILDGRTVELETGHRVRLAGIAAPPAECAAAATEALRTVLPPEADVELELAAPAAPQSLERVAHLFAERRNVNLELIQRGTHAFATAEPGLDVYEPFMDAAGAIARSTLRRAWRQCPRLSQAR